MQRHFFGFVIFFVELFILSTLLSIDYNLFCELYFHVFFTNFFCEPHFS